MKAYALGFVALLGASPAAAITTISFGGSNGAHSVSGIIRYDETAAPSSVTSLTGYQVSQILSSSNVFYFLSDGYSITTGHRASVLDAQPGNTGGVTDSFGAFVTYSSRESFSFTVDYASATALNALTMPAAPPPGPGTFSYSYAGTGYSIPVSWTAQAGAVPEPASWAMLIAGFGVLGGTLRRRPAPAALAA